MRFNDFSQRLSHHDVLGDLTMQETQAFVELLILGVLIDGEITEEELEGLSEQWGQLPFAGDEALETLVGEHGSETREFLEPRIGDEAEISAFLDKIAARIERPEVKSAAIHMVAEVAYADGLDPAERHLCNQLGQKLGLSQSEVDGLIDEVRD